MASNTVNDQARSLAPPTPDDIIASKQSANRQRDLESLSRLLSFREWLKKNRR